MTAISCSSSLIQESDIFCENPWNRGTLISYLLRKVTFQTLYSSLHQVLCTSIQKFEPAYQFLQKDWRDFFIELYFYRAVYTNLGTVNILTVLSFQLVQSSSPFLFLSFFFSLAVVEFELSSFCLLASALQLELCPHPISLHISLHL